MGRREEFETGKPPPLFHGTRRDYDYVPDMVLPASAVGHSNWEDYYSEQGEEWRRDRVFASTSENSAWGWGQMMSNRQGGGRPRVHEVELFDPVDRGEGQPGGEWHGKHGRIKTTHWAPSPKQGGWVQPSLPPMNWEPLGGRHWTDDSLAAIEREIAEERRPKARLKIPGAEQGTLF